MRRCGACITQVRHQNIPNFLRYGQAPLSMIFSGSNNQASFKPVDIIKLQPDYFSGSQSQMGQQHYCSAFTQAQWGCGFTHSDYAFYFRRANVPWQRGVTPSQYRWHGSLQTLWDNTPGD